MAFTLMQAGTALQLVDESGVATTLTLPTGVTLKTDRPPRWSRFGRFVILANTPNRPLSIDPLGVVRVLTPMPPTTAVALSGSGAGNLTGTYKAKETFVIRDDFGNIIAESDFGPLMTTGTAMAAKTITVTGLNISSDAITGSNVYRTTDGGEVYFLWRQLDGNVQTSSDPDDLADLALNLFAAPVLGSPPSDMSLVAEWRGRVWAVSRTDIDTVAYTQPGSMYAWGRDNKISIPRVGSDTRGVTALLATREALVVGRRDVIKQITGTDNTDLRVIDLSDLTGIESQEAIAVWKETIYFLGKDGVYTLDANGIKSISDGKVRSWFATDTYFNRSRFQNAFATFDPVRLKYKLFLSAVGSSSNDRWVEFDITTGTWWGPHKTGAFTPVSGVVVADSSDRLVPMVGSSSGFLFKEQSTPTDDTATAIDFDVDTPFDPQGAPDNEKFWGRLSLLGKVQTAGALIITPYAGYLNAVAGLSMYYVMTTGRQILGRIASRAKLFRMNLRHNTVAEDVELYGYEIEDVHELGNR